MNKHHSLITRRGVLNLKGKTASNQCAKEGHEVYYYEVKVLFINKIKLNQSGWIIDHQLLDDAVQKAQVNSCELMSAQILDMIEGVLRENNLECVGIKLQIKPAFVIEENSAYFQEYRCDKTKNLALIMSL